MRVLATSALLLLAALSGCQTSRDCLETCEAAVQQECETPDMEPCEALCGALEEEATTAGCGEAYAELERCLGRDAVCGGHARCAEERGTYNDCLRAFCEASPEACEG